MKTPFLIAILFSALALNAFGEEITMLYMMQAGYQPRDVLDRADAFFRETGIRVVITFAEYEDRYNLIQQSAAKEAADYDIVQMDLIWTADFAARRIIRPIPRDLAQSVSSGIVPEIYLAFAYSGELWAFPFQADFQLFYTNMDLLSRAGFTRPPATLEEMVQMARQAKSRGVLKYPLFDSWKKQEVLTCEFVWLVGAFGGDLVDADGRINLLTEPCLKALQFMVDLLAEGLMNPYSLESEELFSSEVFLWGDSLFTTNWTFVIDLLRKSDIPESKNWRASLIPAAASLLSGRGIRSSSISGFEGLAVCANSRRQENAWKFIQYLSSPDFQRAHLDYMSVWREVWLEPETAAKDPYIDLKKNQINAVHYRPRHPRYIELSKILQQWLFAALTGETDSYQALREAQTAIDRISPP